MANELDYKLIERQLAILMTNSVAFSSKLYDLFVSATPMDIEFNVWTGVDTFETITVPNRAKGNIPASYGEGSPEGNLEASYGAIYLDQKDGSIYIKTTIDGSDGWLKIITEVDLTEHDRSKLAHDGILAKIDGAYANGLPSTFIVADAIDGVVHETTDLGEDYYAVNKGSLFKLLGGLENLRTEDKSNIVNAINETSEAIHFDVSCAVSGNKNLFSNNTALISIVTDEFGENALVLNAPFVATSPKGIKHTFTNSIQLNMVDVGIKTGNIYSIYLDLDPDSFGNIGKLVVLQGLYRRQARRPYILAEGDGWLDTSSAPYRFVVIEKDEYGNLVEVEKNYAYLGELEQDAGEVSNG